MSTVPTTDVRALTAAIHHGELTPEQLPGLELFRSWAAQT
jgi:hypothetical protein